MTLPFLYFPTPRGRNPHIKTSTVSPSHDARSSSGYTVRNGQDPRKAGCGQQRTEWHRFGPGQNPTYDAEHEIPRTLKNCLLKNTRILSGTPRDLVIWYYSGDGAAFQVVILVNCDCNTRTMKTHCRCSTRASS